MNNKTMAVAIYPNGHEFVIRKDKHGYQYKSNCWSSHFSSAVWQVEQEGGKVERRPNPNYRESDPVEQIWKAIFG